MLAGWLAELWVLVWCAGCDCGVGAVLGWVGRGEGGAGKGWEGLQELLALLLCAWLWVDWNQNR